MPEPLALSVGMLIIPVQTVAAGPDTGWPLESEPRSFL